MIPDPLHPAVVHFPIVLTVIGCAAAVAAVFWPRGRLPQWTAVLLILGAASAAAAYITGDKEKELVGVLLEPVERILERHETWAEATLICSITTAVLGLVAALSFRWAGLYIWFRALTAIAAVVTLIAVFQTGHQGGTLVYEHGVGIKAQMKGVE